MVSTADTHSPPVALLPLLSRYNLLLLLHNAAAVVGVGVQVGSWHLKGLAGVHCHTAAAAAASEVVLAAAGRTVAAVGRSLWQVDWSHVLRLPLLRVVLHPARP